MFETKLETRWVEAVRTRCSVRRYTAPPTTEQLNRLGALSRQLTWQGVRIMLLQGPGMKSAIKGTDVYAAIIGTKDTLKEQEGYAGEALALECTAMGLGTCWLGAGFHKSIVKAAAKLADHEHVTCVLSIGQCVAQTPNHKRKSLSSFCGLADEQRAALPSWQQTALNAAVLAPSAINRQPWRFVVAPGVIQVLEGGSNFGYGPLDRGIAMLHVAVGALEEHVQGVWRQVDKGWEFKANK